MVKFFYLAVALVLSIGCEKEIHLPEAQFSVKTIEENHYNAKYTASVPANFFKIQLIDLPFKKGWEMECKVKAEDVYIDEYGKKLDPVSPSGRKEQEEYFGLYYALTPKDMVQFEDAQVQSYTAPGIVCNIDNEASRLFFFFPQGKPQRTRSKRDAYRSNKGRYLFEITLIDTQKAKDILEKKKKLEEEINHRQKEVLRLMQDYISSANHEMKRRTMQHIEELRGKISTLKEDMDKKEDELKKYKLYHEERIKNYENMVTKLKEDLVFYKREAENNEKKSLQYKEKAISLEQENQKLKGNISSLEQKVSVLEYELDYWRTIVKMLSEQSESLKIAFKGPDNLLLNEKFTFEVVLQNKTRDAYVDVELDILMPYMFEVHEHSPDLKIERGSFRMDTRVMEGGTEISFRFKAVASSPGDDTISVSYAHKKLKQGERVGKSFPIKVFGK